MQTCDANHIVARVAPPRAWTWRRAVDLLLTSCAALGGAMSGRLLMPVPDTAGGAPSVHACPFCLWAVD